MMILVLLMAGAIAAATPQERPRPADDWTTLTARIDRAAVSGSAAALQEIRRELLELSGRSPSTHSGPLVQYAIAYTAWRMAFLSRLPEKERDEMLEDAVTRLRGLVRADAANVEAQALLGGVYAAQLGRSPMTAMIFGGRASGALDRAAAVDPENPRVVLQQGINAFHTPAVFGGGLEKAERLLRRSLSLFTADRADRPWPDWGRVDAHAWLGQLLRRKGDLAGARAEYDKALALAPHAGWIRNGLLPALDRGDKR